MKKTLLVIVLLMVVISVGAQEKPFRRACKKNNQEVYNQFIQKYPQSAFTEEAFYRRALLINTPLAYDAFLGKYPEGPFTGRVIDALCQTTFNQIAQSNNKQQLEDFLAFPYSCEAKKEKAKERIILLDFSEAKAKNTIDAYEEFMMVYPKSKYTEDAKRCIENLEVAMAIKSNCLATVSDFLAKYPGNELLIGFIIRNDKDLIVTRFVLKDLSVTTKSTKGEQDVIVTQLDCSGIYIQSIDYNDIQGKIIGVEKFEYPDGTFQWAFLIEGSFYVHCAKSDMVTNQTRNYTSYTVKEEFQLKGEKFQLAEGKGVMLFNPNFVLKEKNKQSPVIYREFTIYRPEGAKQLITGHYSELSTKEMLTPYHVTKENSRKENDFNYIILPTK
jgi:hypothetical protein